MSKPLMHLRGRNNLSNLYSQENISLKPVCNYLQLENPNTRIILPLKKDQSTSPVNAESDKSTILIPSKFNKKPEEEVRDESLYPEK